jgi:hypothetical protein
MSVTLTSPITGAAQTGLTSPTYTHVPDFPLDVNSKQVAVTALGGTQGGVTAHSVDKPFTLTFKRPKVLKTPSSGANARNNYELLTRKGVNVAALSDPKIAIMRTTIEIPVGSESLDPSSLRAMISAHIGAITQQSAGLGDSTVNGVF